MKKTLSLALLAILLLSACAKNDKNVNNIQADKFARELGEELLPFEESSKADADYFALNFSGAPAPKSYTIYLSDSAPAWEYGVFCMENTADAAKMLTAVKKYLASEAGARASLAALYPSEAADMESAYYRDAKSAVSGTVVYYFAGNESDAASIKSTFEAMHKR